MFVNSACGEVSSGGSDLTGKRFQMERKAYRVCRRNSIIQHGFFLRVGVVIKDSGVAGVQQANAYGMEAFQLIFARILSNPVVQTSQVWPPPSRNTRSDGITVANRSIPGSNRS